MMDNETRQLIEQLMLKAKDIGPENIITMLVQMLSGEDGHLIFNEREVNHGDLKERCMYIFENAQIDFEKNFAVGITFGGYPDVIAEKEESFYREFVFTTFAFYNRIEKEFLNQEMGFEVHRTAHELNMIGIFPLSYKENFVSVFLKPLHRMIEEQYKVELCVGVGMPAEDERQLYNSYRTARYAHDLYFFQQKPIIEFQNLNKKFVHSQGEYDMYLEDTLHAILVREPDVIQKIGHIVDLIAEIHFGNWRAVLMRLMHFTGDLTSKLQKYKLFQGDFFQLQDELQVKILNAKTLQQAKTYVLEYYEDFLPYIYGNERMSSKAIVEEVKSYIQENFMKEISIQHLSEIACVSPNYFSHMFKNEVGQNYKDYLTQVRMEQAIDLILNTDYPLYKIAEAVGYNSTRSFVEAFKKKYHHSPTNYKKLIKKKKEK